MQPQAKSGQEGPQLELEMQAQSQGRGTRRACQRHAGVLQQPGLHLGVHRQPQESKQTSTCEYLGL